MIIIWGTKLYGKVDAVPGMFHVATTFFHMWYIPLIPTGSAVVFEETKGGWRGVKIGMSGKSVLLTWARLGLFIAAITLIVAGCVAINDLRPAMAIGIAQIVVGAIAAAAVIATFVMPMFTKASYERAVQIAEKVGMREEGLVMIELAFKRVSEEDAAQTLRELRSSAASMAELQRTGSAGAPVAPPTAPVGVGSR
jgi:hypothetical protein